MSLPTGGAPDPRDIPILTDAVEHWQQPIPAQQPKPAAGGGDDPATEGAADLASQAAAAQAALITGTLELAESLLQQAARDIEALLLERVRDQLRAQLPELVERVLREHTAATHG